MLRRSLILVPLFGVVVGLVGTAFSQRPLVAAAFGLIVGLGIAAGLSAAIETRLDDITERVRRIARGEPPVEQLPGSQAWRRLGDELAALAVTLQARYDDLAAERTRVERLLDSLDTAVLLFEPQGLAYANPAAQELFGVPRSGSRSLLQTLNNEDLVGAVEEARATGQTVDVEVERDARQLTAHASISGEDVVALIVADVTEARRLDAIRRDFVTNASHELKTPVAGMQALADSLAVALDRDTERATTMVARIQKEAYRLGKMVGELLDLARIEEDIAAGASRQRVDLSATVRIEVERLERLARLRGITLRREVAGPAWLVANPQDLRLIVGNLLENAVRYNRTGGVVTARVERVDSAVVFEVQDNGIGIPEADRDRIFERFYRVDKARSRAAGGTGLGLSIVRNATERHGGEVAVSSVLGEGSTFRVVLPVEGAPIAGR